MSYSPFRRFTFFLLFSCFFQLSFGAATLAFPGAEGFGRFASGGRGGSVYHVTNLNNAGPGSFRDAVSQPNRTVVFDVGGIITLAPGDGSPLPIASNITIAGQTAPGDGICIYGNAITLNPGINVIIRYVRFRMGINGRNAADAFGFAAGNKVILDHVSISWGRDGTLDMNRYKEMVLDSITIQNCIISEGLQDHSTGGLQQTNGHISILRTLFINNWTRNPKVSCNHQYVNNVVYNFGASCYNFGVPAFDTYSNVTNNYFICGPGSTRDGIVADNNGSPLTHVYLAGNYQDKDRNGTLNGSLITTFPSLLNVVSKPYVFPPIANEMTAVMAREHILKEAGASLHRDQVDSLLMVDLKSNGILGDFLSNENQLPTKGPGIVRGGTPLLDTDQDGMPNVWEISHGLNISNPADGNQDLNGDGYTNLEHYLNSIITPEVIKGTEIIGNPDFSEASLFTNGTSSFATGATAKKWYAGSSDIAGYNTTGFQNSIAKGYFEATIPTDAAAVNHHFLGQITTEVLSAGRYRLSVKAKGSAPIYFKISSTNALESELTYRLRNASGAAIEKQSTPDFEGYSLKISPTAEWATYSADLDISNETPSTVRLLFVFPKAGNVSMDDPSFKWIKNAPTTYYIRPTGNATAWTGISGLDEDQIITGSEPTLSGTNTYYFAAGDYTISNTLNMTVGKLYGGFNGDETTIDLNARAVSDKDGNGLAEPWELTNETTITLSAANSAYSETGFSGRMLTVNGGEVNGLTLTDFHYNQPGGRSAIVLGQLTPTPDDVNNTEALSGKMRRCTVRKMKASTGIGILMLSNTASLVDQCLIEDCRVMAGSAGAIYMNKNGGTVSNSVIRNNITSASSGAILLGNVTVAPTTFSAVVSNCAIYNNTSVSQGSAIRGDANATTLKGIELINCTIVNNKTGTTGTASVELVNSGVIANSIILGDKKSEIRPLTASNYIVSTIYGVNGGSPLFPASSVNNVGGIADLDFSSLNFKSPTTFQGAVGNSIVDDSTYTAALHQEIRRANFSITSTSSIAVSTPSSTLPSTFKAAGGTGADVVIAGKVPTTDIMGLARTVNKTLGAYQATLDVANGSSLILNQDLNLAAITIAPSAQLTLNEGKCLTTSALTIQSDATSTGTFLNRGTTTVPNITVQQYLTGSSLEGTPNSRYWYLASPLVGVTSNAFSPSTNQVWNYNELGNSWATAYTRMTATDVNLTPGIGYRVRASNNGNISLTGTALFNEDKLYTNLSDASSDESLKGFHLIGNPYPCYLDITDAIVGATGFETTAWFHSSTNGTNNVYDTYNATTGTGISINSNVNSESISMIPPMQAFWVRANSQTNSLAFSMSNRSHKPATNGQNLRGSDLTEAKHVRLNVYNGVNMDQTLIGFYAQALNGFDNCDSRKMFNQVVGLPEIYSLSGSTELAINGLPLVSDSMEITLGFKTDQAGSFSIKAAEILNLEEDQVVVLKDKQLNVRQNLIEQPIYSFGSEAVSTTTRFSLMVGKIATSLKKTLQSSFDLRTLKDGRLEFALNGAEKAVVKVYDTVGRQLFSQDIQSPISILNKSFHQGVYLLKVTVGGDVFAMKVIIN